MKMNRIQFQKGLSLNQFLTQYGDEQQCESAIESVRWPQGFICPKCGSDQYGTYRRGKRVKVFQCKACRSQTTLTERTIFHSSKIPLTVWFQAMFFQTRNKNNISILEFKRLLGVCYRTAWRIKHKLMEVLFVCEQATLLSGRRSTMPILVANCPTARAVEVLKTKFRSSRQYRPTKKATRFMPSFHP